MSLEARSEPTRDDLAPRHLAAILLGLTLVGLALRAIAIGREPLWSDEALTAILVEYRWWSLALAPVDASPPLFYWLEQALVPAGAGPAGWRMVSLVAGVATIPLTYWLGRELKSRGAGLVAAGLVAMSAPLVDYAQEARAYALAVAMVAGSAAALAALVGGRLAGEGLLHARRRMLAIFAAFTIAAMLSHFVAICWVFPALVGLRLAADGKKPSLPLREMLVTILVILPFVVLELRRLLIYRSRQSGFAWLTQMTPPQFAHILGDQWLPFARTGGALVALAGLVSLIFLLWTVRAPFVAWTREHKLRAAIVAVLLLEPLGLWLLGEVAAPVAMPRTLLPATLGFAALAGVAIACLKRPASQFVGTAVVGLSLASTLVIGTTRHKEQWDAAAAATRDAPLVVTCTNWKTPAFLAAARNVGWVVTSYGNHAQVVRQPGDTGSWDRLYFDRIQRLGYDPLRRDRQLRLDPRPITANRLLFVASDCSQVERDAFARWAGLKQSKLLWSSPRTADAADIRVEEWRLSAKQPLDLWIAR